MWLVTTSLAPAISSPTAVDRLRTDDVLSPVDDDLTGRLVRELLRSGWTVGYLPDNLDDASEYRDRLVTEGAGDLREL